MIVTCSKCGGLKAGVSESTVGAPCTCPPTDNTKDPTAVSGVQIYGAPYRCPVCFGHGCVPAGFYDHPGDGNPYRGTSGAPVECRGCKGKGIILGGVLL